MKKTVRIIRLFLITVVHSAAVVTSEHSLQAQDTQLYTHEQMIEFCEQHCQSGAHEANEPVAVESHGAKGVAAKKTDKKIIAYYAYWAMYGRKYPVTAIPADKITHINYAFVKPTAEGEILILDPWADVEHRTEWFANKLYWGNYRLLADLKRVHPHLKTLISIGGWYSSDSFSALAASAEARKAFAQKAVCLARTYDFDGIDIDWEYPGFEEHGGRPCDKANFTKLLIDLREALENDARTRSDGKPKLLLTIAAPAAPWHLENMEVDKIHQYLDWMNIMGYDFHGPWKGEHDPVTNHQAPLFATRHGERTLNDKSAVDYFINKGVPPQKLVLGMPLYGRSYAGVEGGLHHDGLFSSYSNAGAGTIEKGVRSFGDIKNNLMPQQDWHYFWDDTSKVPYLYNDREHEFISFDDERSLNLKAQFAQEKGLAGAMVWELDHGATSALESIKNGLAE